MAVKDPEKVYRSRIELFVSRLRHIKKIETVLSAGKLLIAAAGIFILYKIAATNEKIYLYMLVADAVLFAVPAVIHEHFIRKRLSISAVKTINNTEIKALQHQFTGYEDGRRYADADHPYSSDLDLFGPRSAFHYVNRAATFPGEECLADWLRRPADGNTAEAVRSRQESVSELAKQLDLRQAVQAHGRMSSGAHLNAAAVSYMLRGPFVVLKKKALTRVIHILPILTAGSAALIAAGLHWSILLVFLATQMTLNRIYREKVKNIYGPVLHSARVLKAYSRIIHEIEGADFSSPFLRKIQNRFWTSKKPASAEIRRLSLLVALLEIRRSEILHPILNSLLLWDLHSIYRLERWKSRIGIQAKAWFTSIGEFEALSSFANLFFNHPDWTFPHVAPEGFLFKASGLGHFLIPPNERICNEIHLEGRGNILIVTGPNMAGKSTFLKTIGINLVLALAGAPVCALALTVSPFRLYTSMKVSDSLDKHLSLFYAELQRLKMILDAILRGEKVFFLLDEMLKGTNALDRQAGALALLKQLIGHDNLGVAATHDLEITRLEADFPDKIKNAHFDGHIKDNMLLFDYKIKPGKCESFNALELMRKIGIKI